MRKSYFAQILKKSWFLLISLFPTISLFRAISLFWAISLFQAISLFRAISTNLKKQFQEMNELITQGFLHTNLRQFGPADKQADTQTREMYTLHKY